MVNLMFPVCAIVNEEVKTIKAGINESNLYDNIFFMTRELSFRVCEELRLVIYQFGFTSVRMVLGALANGVESI